MMTASLKQMKEKNTSISSRAATIGSIGGINSRYVDDATMAGKGDTSIDINQRPFWIKVNKIAIERVAAITGIAIRFLEDASLNDDQIVERQNGVSGTKTQ